MKVPCRVLKGTNGAQGAFYWDGVHPMTVLGGGIGGILVDNALFDLPTVTLTVAQFDDLDEYLDNRFQAFADAAACGECPG